MRGANVAHGPVVATRLDERGRARTQPGAPSHQEHFAGFFAPGGRHRVAVDGPLRLRIVTSLTAPTMPDLVTWIVMTVSFLNFLPMNVLSLTVPFAFFFVNFSVIQDGSMFISMRAQYIM